MSHGRRTSARRKPGGESIFMRSRVPLLSGTVTSRAPAPGGDAHASARTVTPSWTRLSVDIPNQEQTNWCWCATALGVHVHYESSSAITQCEAANGILQRSDACVRPGAPEVNKPYYLDKALDYFGNFKAPLIWMALPFSDIRRDIDANAPVGARIGWRGGGGHFMAITGYLDGASPMVAVDDPIYQRSDMTYQAFCSRYQGTGTWTHTYRTKPRE